MAIRQVQTTPGSLRGAVNSKVFMDGVRAVRKGKPLNYDYSTIVNDQWNYERGRQFALLWDGPVKNGRQVTYSAMFAANNAFKDGVII
jgi:hypothetical protein